MPTTRGELYFSFERWLKSLFHPRKPWEWSVLDRESNSCRLKTRLKSNDHRNGSIDARSESKVRGAGAPNWWGPSEDMSFSLTDLNTVSPITESNEMGRRLCELNVKDFCGGTISADPHWMRPGSDSENEWGKRPLEGGERRNISAKLTFIASATTDAEINCYSNASALESSTIFHKTTRALFLAFVRALTERIRFRHSALNAG